jgi:hypothetical protein
VPVSDEYDKKLAGFIEDGENPDGLLTSQVGVSSMELVNYTLRDDFLEEF